MNPLLISPLLDIGRQIIAKIWPDPAQQAEANLKLLQMQQTGELAQLEADTKLALGQLEINKIEAASPGLFRGGWRPYIGWVCGVALTYHFLLHPIGNGLLLAFGLVDVFPSVDIQSLFALLSAILGLGGLRTFERVKGKS